MVFSHGRKGHGRSKSQINFRSNRLDIDANFLALKMFDKCLLINLIGGRKSLEFEKNGTACAGSKSLRILASVFCPDVFDYCEDSYLSHWNRGQYFFGAYSAATRDNFADRLLLSQPLAIAVFKTGEDVIYHSDQYSCHMLISGALASGFMAANQAMKELELERY